MHKQSKGSYGSRRMSKNLREQGYDVGRHRAPGLKRGSLLNFPLIVLVITLLPKSAYAYLDPGTGSIILQVVLATIFGSLFAIKRYWGKIVRFLKRKNDDKKLDPS